MEVLTVMLMKQSYRLEHTPPPLPRAPGMDDQPLLPGGWQVCASSTR
jgi:hypothetical protein